jgi:CRP/FNR family cyclic AMP-dependent transcriptional regulator
MGVTSTPMTAEMSRPSDDGGVAVVIPDDALGNRLHAPYPAATHSERWRSFDNAGESIGHGGRSDTVMAKPSRRGAPEPPKFRIFRFGSSVMVVACAPVRRCSAMPSSCSLVPVMKRGMQMSESSIDFSQLTTITIEVRKYRAGQTIFKKGDVGFELFVIKQGEVELRLGERVLSTLAAGDIFGEMALVDDSTRSALAIALSDVEIVPISEKQFVGLIRETPSFALDVMRVLARRLRDETRKT